MCLLSFSRGKDSIAAWHYLRRFFRRVVPFFLADVPGLRFVEESLRHFEWHFQTPILRLQSLYTFESLDRLIFQPPERWEDLDGFEMYRELTLDDLTDEVRDRAGVPRNSLVAVGMTKFDDFKALRIFREAGPINTTRREFYPIADWTRTQVADAVKAEGCGLPVDYELFGRSFPGVEARTLEPLRTAYPDDYARIVDLYPLAVLDVYRRQIE